MRMDAVGGVDCLPQQGHFLGTDIAENMCKKAVQTKGGGEGKDKCAVREEFNQLLLEAQRKLLLTFNSHPIGLRWNGMCLHRVNLSAEKYVFLLCSSPKALWWLNWPPEPSTALGIADSQGDSAHDFTFQLLDIWAGTSLWSRLSSELLIWGETLCKLSAKEKDGRIFEEEVSWKPTSKRTFHGVPCPRIKRPNMKLKVFADLENLDFYVPLKVLV